MDFYHRRSVFLVNRKFVQPKIQAFKQRHVCIKMYQGPFIDHKGSFHQCFQRRMNFVPADTCQETETTIVDAENRDSSIANESNSIEQCAIATEADDKIYFIQISGAVEGRIFMVNLNGRIKKVKKILENNRLNIILGKFT